MIKDQNRINEVLSNQPFNFISALFLLEMGYKVKRAGHKDIKYISLQIPDDQSKMKIPYLYAVGLANEAYPFSLNCVDLFHEDWVVIN